MGNKFSRFRKHFLFPLAHGNSIGNGKSRCVRDFVRMLLAPERRGWRCAVRFRIGRQRLGSRNPLGRGVDVPPTDRGLGARISVGRFTAKVAAEQPSFRLARDPGDIRSLQNVEVPTSCLEFSICRLSFSRLPGIKPWNVSTANFQINGWCVP